MDLEGTQLDRYRLVRLLGTGGMGDVYLAEDPRIEQQVAIKVTRNDSTAGESGESRRFLQEVKAVAQLDHPYILPLFDYGEAVVRGLPLLYLVMPLRKEGSLADWLRQPESAVQLSGPNIASLLQQMASALQHAHERHIIHQDVKPSNFLLRFRRETPLPDLFLTDFGIARFSTASTYTSQSPRGTPLYMAPEQWSAQPVPATDQYALAVVAYELLAQRPPFLGNPHQVMYQHFAVAPQPPSTFNNRVTPDMDRAILRGLAKDPAARFLSITAFASAFEQAAWQEGWAGVAVPLISGSGQVFTSADGEDLVKTMESTSEVGRRVVSRGGPADTTQVRSDGESGQVTHTAPPPLPISDSASPVYHRKGRVSVPVIAGSLIALLALAGVLLLPLLRQQLQGHITSPVATSTSTLPLSPTSASPTQIPSSQPGTAFSVPTNWKQRLDDTLRDNSKGYQWEESNGLLGDQCGFSGASYTDNVGVGDTNVCTAAATNFSDLAYQAEMKLNAGDCGGIAFRGNVSLDPASPSYTFYYFFICQDGTYAFSVVNGLNIDTASRTSTTLIHKGLAQTNTLGVIARGQQIELFINQRRVQTRTDSIYTHGVIGVVATGLNTTTAATFTNARAWTP